MEYISKKVAAYGQFVLVLCTVRLDLFVGSQMWNYLTCGSTYRQTNQIMDTVAEQEDVLLRLRMKQKLFANLDKWLGYGLRSF